MFDVLDNTVDLANLDKVLDVGVESSKGEDFNFFEQYFPAKEKITALSNLDASHLEQQYPGIKFIQSDGREMPFCDNTFDLVFSSAVLEHVGSFENQKQFIAECCRVSKKHIFITTPSRYYPIEIHTVLPFIHYLPKKAHRNILKMLGFKFYSKEDNLNLLSKKDLKDIVNHTLGIAEYKLFCIKLFGITSNFVLYLKKKERL